VSVVLCVAAALAMQMRAQTQMNVAQIADFIRSELALKQHSDKQLAAYVKKLKLTEKLTDKTIVDLEAQGAGPKTLEALHELQKATAEMKAPAADATYSPATAPDNTLTPGTPTAQLTTKAPPIPPPDSIRQQQILDAMKAYALNYTQNLPNFVCVQVTRQYVDPNAGDHYRSLGTMLAKVGYNEGVEHYNVYSVNGKLVDTTPEGVRGGGAVSTGEFGSLMREIFEPKSEAEFGWDHWGTLRGRRMAVFNYFIDSGHSNWSITYGFNKNDDQRIITAYRGLVYADPNTGEISRIKFVAVDIPKSFPVRDTTEILDYDLVEISGQKYVAPLMAQLYMHAGRESAKNEIEFRNYKKFGTESSITYEGDPKAPAPLPASKTQEEPAASAPTAKSADEPAANEKSGEQKPAATNGSPWTLPTAPPPPPHP
jgi:hypothetical protein